MFGNGLLVNAVNTYFGIYLYCAIKLFSHIGILLREKNTNFQIEKIAKNEMFVNSMFH